jgi:glycosyltransferase involved in cell wall biosynthesis
MANVPNQVSSQAATLPQPAPWVLVAGGFHPRGGMDRANAALAEYLLERGTPLHLVTHEVETALAGHTQVTVHLVPRPRGLIALGERSLERHGLAVARRVTAQCPTARVLVNGGNCSWPDINWVHSVHHAWPCVDHQAPVWFKIKNRSLKYLDRRRESRALRVARLIFANSEQTKRQLVNLCNINPDKIHTVYLGHDPSSGPPAPAARAAARSWLGISDERPVVIFVGALGHDHNKGLDTLFSAWQILCSDPGWDADLLVAGGGRGLTAWRNKISDARLSERIKLLGFTDRIDELLQAADLLVSPVRYEAYGLNVQEAICRGVPAMVSHSAGVTERYTPELAEMVLPEPENCADIARRLFNWRSEMGFWKERFAPLAHSLQQHTWRKMAHEMVSITEKSTPVLKTSESILPLEMGRALGNCALPKEY